MNWISCDDKLPETHEIYKDSRLTSGFVIVFNGDYVTIAKYEQSFVKSKFRWKDARDYSIEVTHWMPLPDKPEVSK